MPWNRHPKYNSLPMRWIIHCWCKLSIFTFYFKINWQSGGCGWDHLQITSVYSETLAKNLDHKKKDGSYPDFAALVDFVSDVAAEVNDPVYGQLNLKSAKTIKADPHHGILLRRLLHQQVKTLRIKPLVLYVETSHRPYKAKVAEVRMRNLNPRVFYLGRLWHCDRFKAMQPPQRLSIVNEHKLCHNGLLASHTTAYCSKKSTCSVEGCGRNHTMYIHIDNVSGPPADVDHANANACFKEQDVLMPTIKVLVNQS